MSMVIITTCTRAVEQTMADIRSRLESQGVFFVDVPFHHRMNVFAKHSASAQTLKSIHRCVVVSKVVMGTLCSAAVRSICR